MSTPSTDVESKSNRNGKHSVRIVVEGMDSASLSPSNTQMLNQSSSASSTPNKHTIQDDKIVDSNSSPAQSSPRDPIQKQISQIVGNAATTALDTVIRRGVDTDEDFDDDSVIENNTKLDPDHLHLKSVFRDFLRFRIAEMIRYYRRMGFYVLLFIGIALAGIFVIQNYVDQDSEVPQVVRLLILSVCVIIVPIVFPPEDFDVIAFMVQNKAIGYILYILLDLTIISSLGIYYTRLLKEPVEAMYVQIGLVLVGAFWHFTTCIIPALYSYICCRRAIPKIMYYQMRNILQTTVLVFIYLQGCAYLFERADFSDQSNVDNYYFLVAGVGFLVIVVFQNLRIVLYIILKVLLSMIYWEENGLSMETLKEKNPIAFLLLQWSYPDESRHLGNGAREIYNLIKRILLIMAIAYLAEAIGVSIRDNVSDDVTLTELNEAYGFYPFAVVIIFMFISSSFFVVFFPHHVKSLNLVRRFELSRLEKDGPFLAALVWGYRFVLWPDDVEDSRYKIHWIPRKLNSEDPPVGNKIITQQSWIKCQVIPDTVASPERASLLRSFRSQISLRFKTRDYTKITQVGTSQYEDSTKTTFQALCNFDADYQNRKRAYKFNRAHIEPQSDRASEDHVGIGNHESFEEWSQQNFPHSDKKLEISNVHPDINKRSVYFDLKRICIKPGSENDYYNAKAKEIYDKAQETVRIFDSISFSESLFDSSPRDSSSGNIYNLSKPLAEVKGTSQRRIDYFISHAWAGDADALKKKQKCFRIYLDRFLSENNRHATLWLDKVCINQATLDGVALLPINLNACDKILILMNKSYLKRLWCIWELFVVFTFSMSYSTALQRIEILYIDTDEEWDFKDDIRKFNIDDAHCYDPNEEYRLRFLILEVIGKKRLKKAIRYLLKLPDSSIHKYDPSDEEDFLHRRKPTIVDMLATAVGVDPSKSSKMRSKSVSPNVDTSISSNITSQTGNRDSLTQHLLATA